jgi:hypothetical protein
MQPSLAVLASILVLLPRLVLAQDSADSLIDGARAAARKQQAVVQKPAQGLFYDGSRYNFARPEYNGGGGVSVIHLSREYLFRPDNAQVGGPRHVASFIFEPCWQNAGVCLVLLEPIRDIMKASGDQTNPYVYAVASSVLSAAADKFRTIAALNPAYDKYTADKPDAATPAALEILRMMLASSRVIKADDPSDVHHSLIYERETTVAALGASLAGAFLDAAPYLETNLKASLENSRNQRQTVALADALTARARNADTLARLGTAYQRKDPAPTDATRIELMKDIATTARTVWPHALDAAGHEVWAPAVVAAAVPYFDIACAVINDEKNGCAPGKGPNPLCDAGRELLSSVPRKHRANCVRPDGNPAEN